ncbi:MAG: anti-sigma factor [Rhizobiales bacterium]|nr:anti-sigma factor [Hyphomicrobiales bacterium]
MKTIENWALHAYVDGELDAADREAIEKLLASDAAARSAVDAYKRQNDALKQAFTDVLSEPVPASLVAVLKAPTRLRQRPWVSIAAALALVVLGGLGGWFTGRDPGGVRAEVIADNAIAAHEIFTAEVRHPVEVTASERDHLQAWLSKRVGVSFKVPDLTAEGYTLLGGRLLASSDQPAAQLMYEDANKRRITIFLTANPGKSETALRVEERGPLIACYWLDGPLGLVVAGEMDRDRMMKLARIIYDKFQA